MKVHTNALPETDNCIREATTHFLIHTAGKNECFHNTNRKDSLDYVERYLKPLFFIFKLDILVICVCPFQQSSPIILGKSLFWYKLLLVIFKELYSRNTHNKILVY